MLAGAFSLPCLVFGIVCFLDGISLQAGPDRAEEEARGAGFVFVALFCLWIAIRWGRVGFSGRVRGAVRPVGQPQTVIVSLATFFVVAIKCAGRLCGAYFFSIGKESGKGDE
jgi:hypothetical protein